MELAGAAEVRVDLARMGIDAAEVVTGEVDTGEALALQLAGAWDALPQVEVDGVDADARLVADEDDEVLVVPLPAGASSLTITPVDDEPEDEPGRSGQAPGRGGDGPPGRTVG